MARFPTMPEPTNTAYTAAPPFNKPTADLVLRSCDAIDFRIRRGILAEASPIFEDMLSLPQPPPSPSDCHTTPDAPVVCLTEPARTLDLLLRFVYPMPDPETVALEDTCAVLEAARKYLMDHIACVVQRRFAAQAAKAPLRAYSLACARGWVDEMRVAARASLGRPLEELRDACELEDLSAGAYLRLQAYHRGCRKVAASLQYGGTDLSGTPRRMWYTRHHKKNIFIRVEPWWTEYMDRAREALLVRPCGAAVLVPDISYRFLTEVAAKLPLSERTRVLFELTQFNSEFAEAVDRAVSRVRRNLSSID